MRILLLFLIIIGFSFPGAAGAYTETSLTSNISSDVLVALTNSERRENKVLPLVQNKLLAKAAQLKAEEMAARGYFSHRNPDGKMPWYFMNKVGYEYTYAGENLAINFFDSKELAEAWMNSPTHRANMVKKGFKEIGIGIASGFYNGKETIFVAEFFATPPRVKAS